MSAMTPKADDPPKRRWTRGALKQPEKSATGWGKVEGRLQSSAWTPLLSKALTYATAFGALALVGSGAAVRFLPGSADAHLASLLDAPAQQRADLTPGATSSPATTERTASPPEIGPSTADAGLEPPDGGAASGVTADGKIVLNLATDEDLQRLAGIGPAKAKAILALRAKLGRFKRIEDLLRVKGIGRKRLARLRPLVQVDP